MESIPSALGRPTVDIAIRRLMTIVDDRFELADRPIDPLLRKVAIDQHINTRNRWDHLIPVIQKYPNLLGIGLSEATAIIVKGDRFEVMGAWKVAVHDNTRLYQPWEKPYFVLSIGDVYNMKTRKVEKYGNGATPGARPSTEGDR